MENDSAKHLFLHKDPFRKPHPWFGLHLLFFLSLFLRPALAQVTISCNIESEPVLYGINHIRKAFEPSGKSVTVERMNGARADIVILVEDKLPGIAREGFEISHSSHSLYIKATDPSGAMYGAMDVAEQVRMGHPLDAVPVEISATGRWTCFILLFPSMAINSELVNASYKFSSWTPAIG